MLYYNIGAAEIPRPLRCGVDIGVKWFRSNVRHGSRLALCALAIQFVLSFGHFHEAQAAPAIQSGLSQPVAARAGDVAAAGTTDQSAQRQQPAPNRDSDRQSNDGCPICAVVTMANAVLFATPPLLQLPQAVEFLYRTTDAEFVHLQSTRAVFQPRAPPIS
jgi:Protein of unknown function (DUF2946)